MTNCKHEDVSIELIFRCNDCLAVQFQHPKNNKEK